jgi:hypothetical protein
MPDFRTQGPDPLCDPGAGMTRWNRAGVSLADCIDSFIATYQSQATPRTEKVPDSLLLNRVQLETIQPV